MGDDDGPCDRAVGERTAWQLARGRTQAEHGKVVGADQFGEDPLRLRAGREAERHHPRRGEIAQRRRAAGEVDRIRVARGAVGRSAEIRREDGHQPIRRDRRHRFQQQAVDGAEDGGVGADAEGERGDRDEGEAGRADEEPGREPQIGEHRGHGGSS